MRDGGVVFFRRRSTRRSPPGPSRTDREGFFLSPSASGRWAERWVSWILRWKGWRITERNLRTPFGEIDLLARHGSVLVIVEVKFRRHRRQWPLSGRQAARLRRCARWLQVNRGGQDGIRIDLIEVNPRRFPLPPELHHLKSAVVAEEEWRGR